MVSSDEVSKGAHRWLTVHRYRDVNEFNATFLHSPTHEPHRLLVSHLDSTPGDADGPIRQQLQQAPTEERFRTLLQSMQNLPHGIAVAFGNESRGVSSALLRLADDRFCLPMYGFTQSFNLSVAVGVMLASLATGGVLRHGGMSSEERMQLKLDWLIQDTPLAKQWLAHAGLEFDDL
jgi:tRNA (guanosine-2'-O-)-methyltransferase